MTTICLSMIVKNEAKVIRRCLASVKPQITHWAIVDTGSTDDTVAIIREELSGIPGELIERKWEDFATGRNQALDLARSTGADYALFIDADEQLIWPPALKMGPDMTHAVYGIMLRLNGSDLTWTRTVLTRLDLPWRWIGEIHEFLETPGVELPAGSKALITGAAFILSFCDGARNEGDRRKKFKSDEKILRRMIKKDPANARNMYYLGQTLMGLHEWDRAEKAYEQRIEMSGWFEEVYTSMMQMAIIRALRGDHWHDISRAYQRAYEFRPQRAEALMELSILHRDHGEHALSEMYARAALRIHRPHDVLLVNEEIYRWRAADELAGALARLGRKEEAQEIIKRIIELPHLPDGERERAKDNLALLDEPPEGSSQAAA